MALSPPAPRELQHTRRYEFEGFLRSDGLVDIEGHLRDTKSYAFDNAWRGTLAPGEPVHGMSIRLTLDTEITVVDIEAVTDHSPFAICGAITPSFAAMKGVRIGKGWRKAINERLGGVQGCTHLVEMLAAMGTVAFQTMHSVRRHAQSDPERKPGFLDTCHALAADSPVVKQHWPQFYTGR